MKNACFQVYLVNSDNIRLIFGKVLRDLRKQRAISQEDLAFDAGLDRSYISKLETGVYQPSMTTLFAIAEVLKIDPSVIVKRVYDVYVEDGV